MTSRDHSCPPVASGAASPSLRVQRGAARWCHLSRLAGCVSALLLVATAAAADLKLENAAIALSWSEAADGWHLAEARVNTPAGWRSFEHPSGLYTVVTIDRRAAPKLVQLQREGSAAAFFPRSAERQPDGSILFTQKTTGGTLTAIWALDPRFPADVVVKLRFAAEAKTSVSLASPTLVTVDRAEFAWGCLPGNWYGTDVQPDFELATDYSQGLPARPYLANERNTMTLSPLMTTKSGLTIAVIPAPGASVDPWAFDRYTRDHVKLGLGTMDRYGNLTPVVYSPVLGGEGSKLEPGQSTALEFRYTLQSSSWFAVFRHAVMDIYRFPELLNLQTSRESLAERVARLHATLRDDRKSSWKTTHVFGLEVGSNGNKTSDIGAMWMMARTSEDPALLARLPFLRRYKLAQQDMRPGFFQHAATGEYPYGDGFAAERGNWIEPLFTTYYTMLDDGNIVLFDGKDAELKERIRLAAEKLIAWQQPAGGWHVAYDAISHRVDFANLTDLRPTWYGLFVAWRILGDERYLAAARKGADWYIAEAVAKGHYLGACGDALNIWDFTTAFGAQALLDLYEATKDVKYREAAIEVAKVYATTIFTQPVATDAEKQVAGAARRDWEISQVGLSVEHIRGTASGGPILLSSHAGLFVRMYQLTRDELFLDMARAAARGRHHYVDEPTGMSIYYWNALDRVKTTATVFPWHAEWQVGWITDYLMSEANLRSGGAIAFPHGFPTPKVGSHVTYGFAPGTIYGAPALLWMGTGAVKSRDGDLEYVCARSPDRKTAYLIVMNQSPRSRATVAQFDPGVLLGGAAEGGAYRNLAGRAVAAPGGEIRFDLEPWGLAVVAFDAQPK